MRLLFAIPHYFNPAPAGERRYGSFGPDPAPRIRALTECLTAIRQLFSRPQCVIDIGRRTTVPANQSTATAADVVICTTGTAHVLNQLPLGSGYFAHLPTRAEPRLLGFECHAALRDRLAAGYDYYCYLEDDLLIRDPLFFVKLSWFVRQLGDGALLMPNRYEVARDRIVHKAYIDGPLRPDVTAWFQDVTDAPLLEADALGLHLSFRRAANPHSGAFFLAASQMAAWAARPDFLNRDVRFVGPLESAATLGVARTFRVYKAAPECAAFLELEHPGTAFLSQIVPPTA